MTKALSSEEIRARVGEYYSPQALVGCIDLRDRDLCIGLLSDELGFRCVAGCVEVGDDGQNSTVDSLAQEAMRDSIKVASRDKDEFFPGPHPWIESGVGIWTTT